jgi:hypothetical protein
MRSGPKPAHEVPVEFWIKLPVSPDELRRLGQNVPSLDPELESRWDAHNKESWSQWINATTVVIRLDFRRRCCMDRISDEEVQQP